MIFKNFPQIIKKIVLILLFFLIFSNKLYAANVAEDTTISSDATAQQVVTENDVDIILTDNASITRTGQKAIKNTDGDVTGTTLTIHSGSAITSTGANTISTEGGEFTVTNSGTISTSFNCLHSSKEKIKRKRQFTFSQWFKRNITKYTWKV